MKIDNFEFSSPMNPRTEYKSHWNQDEFDFIPFEIEVSFELHLKEKGYYLSRLSDKVNIIGVRKFHNGLVMDVIVDTKDIREEIIPFNYLYPSVTMLTEESQKKISDCLISLLDNKN